MSVSLLKFYNKIVLQAANTIKKIEGLERLEHLTTLHLRDNQLETLDGFSEDMKNLQYINIRLDSIYTCSLFPIYGPQN